MPVALMRSIISSQAAKALGLPSFKNLSILAAVWPVAARRCAIHLTFRLRARRTSALDHFVRVWVNEDRKVSEVCSWEMMTANVPRDGCLQQKASSSWERWPVKMSRQRSSNSAEL